MRRWGLVDCILLTFGFLNLMLAVCFTYFSRNPLDPFAHYTVFLLFVCSLGIIYSVWKTGPNRTFRFGKTDIASSIYFLVLALILGAYQLDSVSIWLDEEIQVAASTSTFQSVVKGAAFTQVPLNYYYTALAFKIFGYREWGFRIISVLAYSGSVFLLYLIARHVFRRRHGACLFTLVYLSTPFLIRYAQEARPYTFGLFCQMLFILVSIRFFRLKNYKEQIRYAPALFACTTFFYLSLAFQTWIFTAAWVLALLFTPKAWQRKQAFIIYCGTLLVASLAIVPNLIILISRSKMFLHHDLNPTRVIPLKQFLWDVILNINGVFRYYSSLLPFFFGAAIFFIVLNRSLNRRADREVGALRFITILCTIYFVLFCGAFSLLVNYSLNTRYLIFIVPMTLALAVLVSNHAIQQGLKILPSKNRYFLFSMKAGAGLFLIGLNFWELPNFYSHHWSYYWNIDVRSMYQYFSEQAEEGDVAYVIAYQNPNNWEQVGFLGSEFYLEQNNKIRLLSKWLNTSSRSSSEQMLKHIREEKPPKHVFLQFSHATEAESLIDFYAQGRPNTHCFVLSKGIYVCKLTVRRNLLHTLTDFLDLLKNVSPEKEKAFRVYDNLISLAREEGNRAKCVSLLNELKSINSKHPEIAKIIQTHEGKCGEPYKFI